MTLVQQILVHDKLVADTSCELVTITMNAPLIRVKMELVDTRTFSLVVLRALLDLVQMERPVILLPVFLLGIQLINVKIGLGTVMMEIPVQ